MKPSAIFLKAAKVIDANTQMYITNELLAGQQANMADLFSSREDGYLYFDDNADGRNVRVLALLFMHHIAKDYE